MYVDDAEVSSAYLQLHGRREAAQLVLDVLQALAPRLRLARLAQRRLTELLDVHARPREQAQRLLQT